MISPVDLAHEVRAAARESGIAEPKWPEFMRAAIVGIAQCQMIVAFGDFWHSRVSMVELRVAEAINMPMFELTVQGNLKPLVLKKAW